VGPEHEIRLSSTDRPPEEALPWQKLAVVIRSLVNADEAGDYERQIQASYELLVSRGIVDAAEVEGRVAELAVRLASDQERASLKTRYSNAGPNDIGGLPGGPIDRRETGEEEWELESVALREVLGIHRLVNLHEMRRAVEELGEDYHRLGYYERRMQAIANVLYEKGVLRPPEVEARMRGTS
jgi:hypothetical protein